MESQTQGNKCTSPARNRQRYSFTLSDETVAYLESLVTQGEATSISRAIDMLTKSHQFYSQGVLAYPVSSHERKLFLKFCLNQQKQLPGAVLAQFIREKTDTPIGELKPI